MEQKEATTAKLKKKERTLDASAPISTIESMLKDGLITKEEYERITK